MPKRFTDREIWEKEWFMEFSPYEKLAFQYIKDRCDNVGVWTPNKRAAEFFIGGKVDWDALLTKCNGNIEILDNGKWFILDFCDFQYGELSEESKSPPVQSYIRLLKKHNLYQRVCKGYAKVTYTHKEKEKDKDKDKDKEKKKIYAPAVSMTEREYTKLVGDYGQTLTNTAVDILSNWKKAKGKTYKSDYHAILTWAMEKAGGKSREELKMPPKAQHCKKCGKSLANEIKNGVKRCYSCDTEFKK